jgi:hypothetical protein
MGCGPRYGADAHRTCRQSCAGGIARRWTPAPYVDDQSWPIVDTSGETVVLVGLAPGPHKGRLELADTIHRPIPGCSKVMEFTIPAQQRK